MARSGWINGNDVIAVIDEAHGLDITMIGVHLALRGVPKVLMTADPALLIKLSQDSSAVVAG